MDINGKMSCFLETSPATIDYNCIAWAAEEDFRCWWPVGYYWPEEVPRIETLEAFIAAFRKYGYEVCEDSKHETGFKKVAIYIDKKRKPTHAARQLSNGSWTSKLGGCIDIEHDFITEWLDAVIGVYHYQLSQYGILGAILKKPI